MESGPRRLSCNHISGTEEAIRCKSLNHHQFKLCLFLKETKAAYHDIPYHIDLKWLSKGRVSALSSVELRAEIHQFLNSTVRAKKHLFDDKQLVGRPYIFHGYYSSISPVELNFTHNHNIY